jgi:hypothetical protein
MHRQHSSPMNTITHPLTAIVLIILLCKIGTHRATADDNTGIPLQLQFTLQDEIFRFRLTGTPSNERNPWIIQSSVNLDTWHDLAFIEDRTVEGNLEIELPAASMPNQEQPNRFFRARRLDADDPVLREFLTSRDTWRKAGIDSYSMEISWGVSWFFWHGNVTVRNNQVVSVEAIDTNFFEPPEPRTMEDWLDNLKSYIDRKAERIDVTYDKAFGFPSSVFIDVSFMIADEEQGWTILNFLPHR